MRKRKKDKPQESVEEVRDENEKVAALEKEIEPVRTEMSEEIKSRWLAHQIKVKQGGK